MSTLDCGIDRQITPVSILFNTRLLNGKCESKGQGKRDGRLIETERVSQLHQVCLIELVLANDGTGGATPLSDFSRRFVR